MISNEYEYESDEIIEMSSDSQKKKYRPYTRYLLLQALINGIILAAITFSVLFAIYNTFAWPFLIAGTTASFLLGTITGLLKLGFLPLNYIRGTKDKSTQFSMGTAATLVLLLILGAIETAALLVIFGVFPAAATVAPSVVGLFATQLANPISWIAVGLVSLAIVTIPLITRVISNAIADRQLADQKKYTSFSDHPKDDKDYSSEELNSPNLLFQHSLLQTHKTLEQEQQKLNENNELEQQNYAALQKTSRIT